MSNNNTPRSFARLLLEIGEGEAETELTEKLNKLLVKLEEEAERTNGAAKGKIQFELSMQVAANGTVSINYSSKVTEPKPVRPNSVMFLKDGHLQRESPRQMNMYPTEVPRNQTVADIMEGANQ